MAPFRVRHQLSAPVGCYRRRRRRPDVRRGGRDPSEGASVGGGAGRLNEGGEARYLLKIYTNWCDGTSRREAEEAWQRKGDVGKAPKQCADGGTVRRWPDAA